MTLEEALRLVEEIRNCSLWGDAHREALSIVIEYAKNKSNDQGQNTKWSEEDEHYFNKVFYTIKSCDSDEIKRQSSLSCINWLNSLRNRNCNNHEKREDANVIKYKVGDKVKFYSDSSEVFTISKIENNRYIFADGGGDAYFYEELIPVEEPKGTLTRKDVKCGDYVVNKEDRTVIKVHDIDSFGRVCFFYFAKEMTEDGGKIQDNRAFMQHYGNIHKCRWATQSEIDFLEKWVAHKKYIWVEDNVSPDDEVYD